MKKTGHLIALFGPDGTGKSTTADLLEDMCRNNGIKTYRHHWRPRILPSLKKVNNIDYDVSRPNDQLSRSWLVSLGVCVYIYLDFLVAYIVKFRPLLREGAIIIYERYYYDLLFHPKRYKLRSIGFMAKLLTSITPCPNLIVLLSGEPSVILARKPELPLAEIIHQQKMMQQYLPKLGRFLKVDVTATEPIDVVRIIYKEIYQNDFASMEHNHKR